MYISVPLLFTKRSFVARRRSRNIDDVTHSLQSRRDLRTSAISGERSVVAVLVVIILSAVFFCASTQSTESSFVHLGFHVSMHLFLFLNEEKRKRENGDF